MRAMTLLAFLLLASSQTAATTRVLFSNYAPESEPVALEINGEAAAGPIGYPASDAQYRLTEPGSLELAVLDAQQSVVAARTVTLTPGDYSVFFYTKADGSSAIEVARDALAGFDFPPPFDFETNDGNAAVRFLSFARLPVANSLALTGRITQIFTAADGTTSEGGEFRGSARLGEFGGAAIAGSFPANVNSIVSNNVVIEAGVATQASGAVELAEVLISGEFTPPVGTTDYVVIGSADNLQVIERPRPGNRSMLIDGLYGETGINGSGIQIHELREIGRLYGLLYTYREDGSSVWYYLDSRCDLDRGFQCTTPGLLVAGGSYLVALYEATNGMPAPGVDAELQAIGTARVRVDRMKAAFIGEEEPVVAEVLLFLEPPMPGVFGEPDAQFFFQRLAP